MGTLILQSLPQSTARSSKHPCRYGLPSTSASVIVPSKSNTRTTMSVSVNIWHISNFLHKIRHHSRSRLGAHVVGFQPHGKVGTRKARATVHRARERIYQHSYFFHFLLWTDETSLFETAIALWCVYDMAVCCGGSLGLASVLSLTLQSGVR